MRLLFSLLLLISASLVSGCATRSSHPDWIGSETAKYGKSDYLIGRGQAASVEDAKKYALANLSEIFQASIKDESEEVRSVKRNAGIAEPEQLSTESTRRINTTTEQIISGIQIAEIWQDPVANDFHVLAVLNRQQTVARLKQQSEQLEQAVQAAVEQSNANADLLVKIASLNKAIDLQLELESLQKALQVVSLSGRGLQTRYNSGRLKIEQDELLRRVRVALTVLPKSAPGLEDVVAGALSHAGFMIDTGEAPVFLMKAALRLTDIGKVDGWYWQRGNLEISVSESATGRVRGVHRWPVKGSGKDRATAIRRALDVADAVLKSELRDTLVGMATGTQ